MAAAAGEPCCEGCGSGGSCEGGCAEGGCEGCVGGGCTKGLPPLPGPADWVREAHFAPLLDAFPPAPQGPPNRWSRWPGAEMEFAYWRWNSSQSGLHRSGIDCAGLDECIEMCAKAQEDLNKNSTDGTQYVCQAVEAFTTEVIVDDGGDEPGDVVMSEEITYYYCECAPLSMMPPTKTAEPEPGDDPPPIYPPTGVLWGTPECADEPQPTQAECCRACRRRCGRSRPTRRGNDISSLVARETWMEQGYLAVGRVFRSR